MKVDSLIIFYMGVFSPWFIKENLSGYNLLRWSFIFLNYHIACHYPLACEFSFEKSTTRQMGLRICVCCFWLSVLGVSSFPHLRTWLGYLQINLFELNLTGDLPYSFRWIFVTFSKLGDFTIIIWLDKLPTPVASSSPSWTPIIHIFSCWILSQSCFTLRLFLLLSPFLFQLCIFLSGLSSSLQFFFLFQLCFCKHFLLCLDFC